MIQDPRIKAQAAPCFPEVILPINQSAPSGTLGCRQQIRVDSQRPDARGDALELNWLLMSDNLCFVADLAVTELMGFDYRKIPYLRYILAKEQLASLDGVESNAEHRFRSNAFYLSRH